jgi:hypothetical protein
VVAVGQFCHVILVGKAVGGSPTMTPLEQGTNDSVDFPGGVTCSTIDLLDHHDV